MTPGEWATVEEAAVLLGKSARTVRRYVKQGKLEVDRSHTPMLVKVADSDRQDVGQMTAKVSELEGKVERLAGENADLRAAVERLEDVLEEVRSERDYLRQAHAASLSNQRKLLEAKAGRSWLDRLLPWRREEEA